MTSLPISLPKNYKAIVKKGDVVKAGQIVAASDSPSTSDTLDETPSENEVSIDLSAALNASGDTVRKYLQRGPGDSILRGDIIAKKPTSMGLKREEIVATVSGTIVRYERDTGQLIVRTEGATTSQKSSTPANRSDIISPLEGTVTVCNNDAIVVESEDAKADSADLPAKGTGTELVGTQGRGSSATGKILVLSPLEGQLVVSGAQITKETIDTILLLPDIDKEAVAKASAIGVKGIIGTALSEDLFGYLQSRKIDLPIITVDPEVGKKILRTKNDIVINGQAKTIIL